MSLGMSAWTCKHRGVFNMKVAFETAVDEIMQGNVATEEQRPLDGIP